MLVIMCSLSLSLSPPVFDTIEGYAPGFKDLIIDWEMLTPPDLERIFGLTGGVSKKTCNLFLRIILLYYLLFLEYISWVFIIVPVVCEQANTFESRLHLP